MNWAIYLGHLQAVFKKFNPITVPNKKILIWYFQEGLWPSIQTQIDNWHQELNSQDKMLNKAIKVKFKAALQSFTSIQEIDACYQKNRRLNKKEKTFKPFKKEYKTKPANNQPTNLSKTGSQSFSQNLYRT